MFKRILKTLLNIILFLCLVILSYLTIIRGVFLESVSAKSESIDISKIKALKNYDAKDLHKVFDGILNEYNIPPNLIDEIINDETQKKEIDEYLDEVINSVENNKPLPEIPTVKIEKILETSIQSHNQKYNDDIALSKVKQLVKDISRKGEIVLNFVNQNLKVINGIRFVFNDTAYYSLLVVTLVIIIVIAVIYKTEAIFSLGGISIFNGLVLLITYFILKITALQNILEFLPINLQNLKNTFLLSSIAFIITGFVLFGLYRILLIHQEKNNLNKGIIKNANNER